jgi:cytochrome c-type biogenesis protein CcmH/NrfG
MGNVSRAIATYKHAINLAPHLSGVHCAPGEALRASHSAAQQEEAVGEYERALRDNPDDVGAESRLGDIEFKRSHIQSAIQQLHSDEGRSGTRACSSRHNAGASVGDG